MKHRVVSEDDLYLLLAAAMENFPVMGSTERADQPGFYHFHWLDDPRAFAPSYTTTTLPPKAAFFPPDEKLFSFTLDHRPRLKIIHDKFEFILAGVHPCDLAAIDALDRAYSHPPADLRWLVNRRRALIIGFDCQPDAYCFCPTTGTAEFRKNCDLFLTSIDRGYLVEMYTASGRSLLAKVHTSPVDEKDFQDAERWRRQKNESITAAFDVSIAELADILATGGLTDVWQEVAGRC